MVTPFLIPWLTVQFGWQMAFVVTGLLGFVWLAFWLPLYHNPEDHPHITQRELEYIKRDPGPPAVKIPYMHLLRFRTTWAYAVATLFSLPF